MEGVTVQGEGRGETYMELRNDLLELSGFSFIEFKNFIRCFLQVAQVFKCGLNFCKQA